MKSVYERIQEFNKGLLPDMVLLKYKSMAENAFRFFRGTCHLFYEDLSHYKTFPPSPLTWICGDLHLENFGCFKANNRMEYFDLNDFDEAILAPCSWELVRIITSIYVAFLSLRIKKKEATEMAKLFIEKYTETLKGGKAYYLDPRTANGIVRVFLDAVKKRTENQLLNKHTTSKKENTVIRIDKINHFAVDESMKKDLKHALTDWIDKTKEWPNNYKVKDIAFRLAGTGSVGLKRYMFLLQSKKIRNKFLFVEVKEARKSSLSLYVKTKQPGWTSEAERVISIKKRIQNVSPALLSTITIKGTTYVLQEMQPTADKINFEEITDKKKALQCVLEDMAVLTASAQIRSGGMQGSAITDDLIAFGKDGKWEEKVLSYAETYSKQVFKDYQQFVTEYSKT